MYGFIFLSAVPMRLQPSDRSEMVNQLLMGDTFQILERAPKWSRIRCDLDGYEGWVDNKQYHEVSLDVVEDARLQRAAAVSASSPSEVALNRYLSAPYLWGGRTVMGIDCSGLTQVCFLACGVTLLRDASQQATQGIPVPTLQQLQKDDLCFFQNEEGRIIHVGISLGDGRIIHASGYVRIDRLDDTGIFDEQTHSYTHRLHSLRRIIRS